MEAVFLRLQDYMKTKAIIFGGIIVAIVLVIFLVPKLNIPPADNSGGVSTFPQTYKNTEEGFSIRYPLGYTVQETNGDWFRINFLVPASTTADTNLSEGTQVSVEKVAGTENCTAKRFLGEEAREVHTVTENGTVYSMGTSGDAGAGNFYEQAVYALPGSDACFGVRYFIHYTNIQNYPEGAVQEFDKQALIAEFDAIRRTLVIVQ